MATQEILGLTIEKGEDFSTSFVIESFDGNLLDLTNYTAISKIRKYPSSPNFKSFETEVLGSTGYVNLIMSRLVTATLSSGRNYFDVLLTNGIETIKPIKGTIMVEETASL
jgi:hypothetical protein